MEVRELEHRPASTCNPDTPIGDVARIMQKDNVGSVLIVDEHGALKGIVTDRDIVTRALTEDMDARTPVERVMTPDVTYLYENADVFVAAGEIAQRGVRRLPVLDTHGKLTGVVSFDDLVVTLSEQIGRLAHAVRKEMARDRHPKG